MNFEKPTDCEIVERTYDMLIDRPIGASVEGSPEDITYSFASIPREESRKAIEKWKRQNNPNRYKKMKEEIKKDTDFGTVKFSEEVLRDV